MLTLPAKPRTKEEYAYDVIREAILRCELKPGEKLVIDSLSEKLGVSAIPLRGALQRLQSEGLVEITPHTGTIVSELSPGNIEQVSLLLERLEILSFEVLAQKATDADIAQLRKVLAEMDRLLETKDLEKWSELNLEFHRIIGNLTGMKLLIEFLNRALDGWMRLRRWYLHRIIVQMPQSQAEHHEMVELLARRDVPNLTRVVIEHNRRMREYYQQAITDSAKNAS